MHTVEDHVQDAGDPVPGAETGSQQTLAVEFLNLGGNNILICTILGECMQATSVWVMIL